MESSFKSIIGQSKSILVLLPKGPQFDHVAAGLSLFLTLRSQKEVSIVSPNTMTVEFNRLIGVDRITKEFGKKNLIIQFVDYKANDIERVSYDIENREFRLTVIPKPGVNAPDKDQVKLNYSGMSADTVILVGGMEDSDFPELSLKDFEGVSLVHVGTRELTLSKRRFVSFAAPASSVSELVALLIKDADLPLDSDVATNLVMGIEEGSNKFLNPETKAETFALFADLLGAGGKRAGVQQISASDFPPGAIPMTTSTRTSQVSSDSSQQKLQEVIKSTKVSSEEKKGEAPKEWLQQPKILKGGFTKQPSKDTSMR